MRSLNSDFVLNVPPGKNDVPYATKLELVRSILANNAEVAAGTVTGTGAAFDVALPFDPGFVWACKTAGTGAPVQAIKHPGLPDDDCIKTVAAGTVTVDTAGLITLGGNGQKKFSIGTDADLNENAQPIRWLAIGFRNYNGFQ
jgi:hypothetical protein